MYILYWNINNFVTKYCSSFADPILMTYEIRHNPRVFRCSKLWNGCKLMWISILWPGILHSGTNIRKMVAKTRCASLLFFKNIHV